MKNKSHNIIISAVFAFIILALSVLFIFSPKETFSNSERRALATFPTLSHSSVSSGAFFDGLDSYLSDNFPMREQFRAIKAVFGTKLLFLKENNGITEKNGYFAKVETNLSEASLKNAAAKLGNLLKNNISGSGAKVYLSIIPDKNYFLSRDYGYPSLDYEKLIRTMRDALPDAEYIDIFGTLSLESYYKTDTHWRQEEIVGTAAEILKKMNAVNASQAYNKNALDGFSGVYSGQSALSPKPETLYYLTNDQIDAFRVFDFESRQYIPVYDTEKFSGGDGYDVFLSGAKPLLKISNPAAETERELIVFRDSYGSSIAPLLAGGYKSVTLIDIRYISPSILENYVSFEGADVLFLYSALILNNSFSFK